jgi:hypothetical protein
MGERNSNPIDQILMTLTSKSDNKFMPETLQTEAKKSKYDEAFEFFVYKYIEDIKLN